MITRENLQVYLPQYLCETDQKKLVEEIKQFTENRHYENLYNSSPENFLYQGDGIVSGGLVVCDIAKQEFKETTPCLILTNTCDMALENSRTIPLNLCYAPVFNLGKYEELLIKIKGTDFAKQKCDEIRRQEITSYFYLPPNSGLDYESFVHLDKINNVANSQELTDALLNFRAFSFNQFGHYLFLFKMSIHFTRIREGDIR